MTEFYMMNTIRSLMLLIVFISQTTNIYAQQNVIKLTIELENATLEDFIKHVELQSGYAFIYGEEVKLETPITINVKQRKLKDVLDLAFNKQPVGYEITGRHILLHQKKLAKETKKYTISGYVTDGASGETLIGANIIDCWRHRGTTSNPYGFYSLTLPEGNTELSFSYMGYDLQRYMLTLKKDTVINIAMHDNNQLQEVVILSDKTESGINSTHMSAIDIPIAHIKNTPTILGEADVMKSIQLMPGVQAGMEGAAGIHVRGGSSDQNLILLDGVPVYNVDHVFGFFSIFTPEAVKKVTLYKGSFPARYGGRLSSVIDVRTNDGDLNKYHGLVSLGLLTSRIQLEGPIIKNKTAFNVSARRSYIDLVSRPFIKSDDALNYYFYDVNAKINHRFSDRARLFLSFYNGKDRNKIGYTSKYEFQYREDDGSLYTSTSEYQDWQTNTWGNMIGSARLNLIFNQKLFVNMTAAYNQYQMSYSTKSTCEQEDIINTSEKSYISKYNSGMRDWSYMIDFDYNPVPTHDIKFGTTYQRHSFRPEIMTNEILEKEDSHIIQDTLHYNTNNSKIRAHEVSAYIEDNFNIGSRLRMNIGVHFSMFNVNKKNYFSAQPRVSARLKIAEPLSFKASYTQMFQYMHLLTSNQIGNSTDLWVPVTNNIKPMESHQYSAGFYYVWPKGWEFSVEGYYKDMRNILEYKDGSSFWGNSTGWEDKIAIGKGRSMGVEFMLQKLTGKATGWINYTLAKTDRIFPDGDVNHGLRFPYKYDCRHNVNVVFNYKFNNRIDISSSWIFSTGGTKTIAEEGTAILSPGGYIIPDELYEQRNNYRLPPTHRLNIGVNFNKKTKRGIRTWNISVYNVYNAMNPSHIYNDSEYNIYSGSIYNPVTETYHPQYIKGQRKITKITFLPCLPSVSYTFRF